jgi:hypothetical protein
MSVDMPTARVHYREAAVNFWVALREKDAIRANEESARADRLAEDWARQGRAGEFLEPLLHDVDPEVRFAAASDLLLHSDEDTAIRLLEELQSESSVVGPTAWLRLTKWRRDGR